MEFVHEAGKATIEASRLTPEPIELPEIDRKQANKELLAEMEAELGKTLS